MQRFNSLIKHKTGECEMCADGKKQLLHAKGLCFNHYWMHRKLTYLEKQTEKEIEEDGLPDLIADADAVFSKWLRKSQADKNGIVVCFTCDVNIHWTKAQAGHFAKRGNLFLRFDERNVKIQCETCNITKSGNYKEFTKRLNLHNQGIADILMEESHIVYKPTREEIKSIIADYSNKLKTLMK